MKNKKWLYIGGGAILVAIIGIVIYRRRKTAKTSNTSSGSKSVASSNPLTSLTNVFTGNKTTEGGYTINKELTKDGNFQFPQPKQGVDINAKGILNIVGCLDRERRNVYGFFYNKGGKIYSVGKNGQPDSPLSDERIGQMYWIFTEQTLQKLEKGLASDTTINEATKEYGNVLIKTFRAYYETIFPKDKYNVNQSWAKLNLSGYNNYTSGCQQ
jgi:hypothetical protein